MTTSEASDLDLAVADHHRGEGVKLGQPVDRLFACVVLGQSRECVIGRKVGVRKPLLVLRDHAKLFVGRQGLPSLERSHQVVEAREFAPAEFELLDLWEEARFYELDQ